MIRTPRSLHLVMVLLLTLSLGLATGCASPFSAIDESALSEQDKATAKLYSAESSWVQAKSILADVLTELTFAGVQLDPGLKLRLKQVLAGGNQAISAAAMALPRGDTSATGLFAASLRTLQSAIRSLIAATPVIPAPAVAAAPEREPEEVTP